MKKKLCLLLSGIMIFSLVGCGSDNKKEEKSQDTNVSENDEKETESASNEEIKPQELNVGEWFTIETERGSYKFTVDSVNYLPATDYRNDVLQLVYEYENIDFKADLSVYNVDYSDVVYLPADYIKVVDNNGYILSACNMAWKDEWQEAVPIKAGEKSLVKMTYNLQTSDISSVKVSFDRLDEKNVYYNVNVTR